MALPPTTTISQFPAPSTVYSSRPPSPMEDDDKACPLYSALLKLTHCTYEFRKHPLLIEADLRSFLTNTTPNFPQGIPHDLGLHIAPRDYHGSAKPARVAGTGLPGMGKGSHFLTCAKPIPVGRVPAGTHGRPPVLLALHGPHPQLCHTGDTTSQTTKLAL
ncbi:hypothetical protein EDB86DRAFT_2838856 [Lactarius hatsudake]|nr:hypothetical protein EDB86DRAFT_2838856 [Lactarius hatsudake]